MSTQPDPEVMSHAAALRYTTAMTASADSSSASLQQTVATMRQRQIGPAAIGHLTRAGAEAGLLAEQLRAAEAVLRGHDVVRDAYAAAPDAGDKTWTTTDDSPGANRTESPADVEQANGRGQHGVKLTEQAADTVDREKVLADRRAKADVLVPLAELARIAANIADVRDDDEDADPDRLLDQLLTAVGNVTREAGLGDLHPRGASVPYDPQRHIVSGEPPAPGEPIEITNPGLGWHHGGEQLVLGQAWGYRVDVDRGAYIVTTPDSLDETVEHEEAIWLDDDDAAALNLACYSVPGYYTVLAVSDCEADDEDCPAHGTGLCDGRWVELYGGDPEQSEVHHFAGDARIILDCNGSDEQ